jgi:DNA-binding NtrC family response regulator
MRSLTRLDPFNFYPKMGGPALAKQLTILRPETRVLYMSGYTGSSIFAQELAESGPELLQKPFTCEKLARKVREVLDSAAEFVAGRGNSQRTEDKSCRES